MCLSTDATIWRKPGVSHRIKPSISFHYIVNGEYHPQEFAIGKFPKHFSW